MNASLIACSVILSDTSPATKTRASPMKAPVQLESGGRAFDHTDSYWENWEEKQGLSYSQEDLDAVDNNNKQKEVEVIIQRENTEDMPSATSSSHGSIPNNEDCGIRDVWKHNMEEEFRTIRQLVTQYNYIAMDTEFPGVVARPIGEFRSTADYQYQLLRCNVDLLRIIQLGLTFYDKHGKTPSGYTTWQFNFKFNLSEDMYAQDSIDLLTNSGIQFKKHEEDGIDPLEFAEILMTSGIVLMDNIKWLSFHSGYDFGYLLKLLTDQNLPQEEADFFDLLKIYFPVIYDIKYLMKSCKNLKGGLQEVADQLELRRVGPQHQAGSDSLLTGMAFFKMREMFFEDNIDDSKYSGHLYGLGMSFSANGNNTPFHDNGDNSSSS
ncbi:CCR4-NOT transcription complex subunit 7-like isoform X3 [Ctenocephalides felis]|uniref:CCR4-NOT transcription complex subunit 7-like isoform X3 n=2 Tax=Ctenocephalides felis TaxID=7515 RepID=UPI000E6E1734|nr:CCR4-NOT transcription complex subunit 7-like isoform X3 [Ctenocephalides felis]